MIYESTAKEFHLTNSAIADIENALKGGNIVNVSSRGNIVELIPRVRRRAPQKEYIAPDVVRLPDSTIKTIEAIIHEGAAAEIKLEGDYIATVRLRRRVMDKSKIL